ncbi:DUF927 domain-containing protein [Clostridium butyricum]|uniref:DUF927 domain-containing protein n=1 Tax=Clostridium butyricum TaxID=1492 RepID=UPI00136A2A34|nr:DUF927 domain-containing protein [Clostridium butyricum]MZI82921.1 DUF927 domain-containing protein [Clostridium butyricum]
MKFIVDNGKVYGIKSSKGEKIFLFNEIVIVELIHNVDENEYKARIEYEFAGEKITMIIPRSRYQTKRNLLALQDNGVDVTEETSKYMVQYLKQQEENVKVKKVHSKPGYCKEKNSFRLYKSIPQFSTYDGPLDLEPKGKSDEWMGMYRKYIKDAPELQFMIVIGLSSLLVGMIGQDISMENPIVHIYGDSSTGKTTGVQLALSTCGNPNLRGNGLMKNFNGTNNSFMFELRSNNGLPICFDEISMSICEDFSQLIYAFANGKDKGRLGKQIGKGYIKLEEGTWNTVIISTGEYDILERVKENDGLKVRVFSIGGVKWTGSADISNKIKRCVTKNYGFLGIEFAELLLKIGSEELIDIFQVIYEKLLEDLKSDKIYDDFTHRRANYYSILILVCKLINTNLGFEINIDQITSMIKDIESTSISQRNVGIQSYNKFLELIAKNRRKFPLVKSKKNRGNAIKDDIWGYVLQEDYQVEIFPEEFKKQCKLLNFQSSNVILSKWKGMGKLDHESDRNDRQRNGTRVYVMKVDDEFMKDFIKNKE